MDQLHPLDRAAKLLLGRDNLAKLLSVTPAAIGNWKSRGVVPIEHCPEIERLTVRAVTRQELRPSDWHRLWPELVAVGDDEEAKHVHSVESIDAAFHHNDSGVLP